MRRFIAGTRRLGVAMLMLAGCNATLPWQDKPKRPEEYLLPPADDARFSAPVSFPKETLNKELPKRSAQPKAGLPQNGMGGRMGGAGM